MDPAEISAAAAKANLGDKRAAQLVISELLPYWNRAAASIALNPTDAEDLVQDALFQLLKLWQRGDGPTSNPRAYVTATMRNSFVSYKRSPRSRTIPASEDVLDLSPSEGDPTADIDFSHEAKLVRKALGALSVEHRAVLEEIVVNGKKPRDVVDRLNRPAPAVSALLLRAKRALRRALLVAHLQEGDAECVENAERLPPAVSVSMNEQQTTDPGMAHILQCRACSSNWRKYGAAILAFGAIPLLVVSQPLFASTPARADEGPTGPSSRPDHSGIKGPHPGGKSTWYQGAQAFFASKGFVIGGVVLATALGAGAMISAVAGSSDSSSRSRTDTSIDTTVSPSSTSADRTRPTLVAEQRLAASGALSGFSFHLEDMPQGGAKLTSLSVMLPEGSGVLAVGNGLHCSTEASKVNCLPSAATDLNRETNFEIETKAQQGEFEVQLQLVAGGQTFEGYIVGNW